MSKKNKYQKYQHIQSHQIVDKLDPIPYIIGADFDYAINDVEKYKTIIANAPLKATKTRILFVNEASYLHTGFSTYGMEVMKRLHATGKYELAELASYGFPKTHDPRAKLVPWKYYPTRPTNMVEQEEYATDQANQFGKAKFTYAVADFKPDIVVSLRDWWMDEWVLRNPLRNKFHFVWMPTVDGYPQKWDWLRDYNQVDTICAYSHFGKRVLEEQSRLRLAKIKNVKPINVYNVIQPGVNLNVFKPLNKVEVRKQTGIPLEFRFAGTVMRNQPRKLFPRIIEAFSIFKRNYPAESHNVFLLLHTSIPDVGWDGGRGILEVIERCNLEKWVMFSYICRSCRHMAIQPFLGSPTTCPKCGRKEFWTPNVEFGYDPEHFNIIYNLMDVYIQGSIAEGDGMPINEAKSTGCPVLVSDYSAMYEKARNGGGFPIQNATLFDEGSSGCPRCGEGARGGGGTMQWRSLFDTKDLAKLLGKLFGNEDLRRRKAAEARICAEKYYDWDLTALKWEALFDSIPLKDRSTTWEGIGNTRLATKENPPEGLNDEDWLLWVYQNILVRTKSDGTPVDKVDADGRRTWLGALKQGATRKMIEDRFRGMMSENDKINELLKNPDKASLNPMERIAAEVREAENGIS